MPDHNPPSKVFAPGIGTARRAEATKAPRRRWLVLAIVAAFGAGLGGVLLLRATPPDVAAQAAPVVQPPAMTVSVVAAERRSLARAVVGDGSVVAWQELVIGAETGGLRVAEVAVEEGDAIRRGDLLVRLEDAVVAAQRDHAAAAVQEAQAALQMARQDLTRAVELTRTQSVPRQTLEQRQAAALQAEAKLVAAQALRAEAEARLRYARIVAPMDGVVSRRAILVGAVTSVGQEMARLIRDGRLELDARVPELELAAVRPGQRVRVTHGDLVTEAVVRAVAPTVSQETRLGIVHIALPPGSGLRSGMFAHAEILPDGGTVLVVPQEAVLFRSGQPVVFVLAGEGDRVAARPVVTGRRRDGVVEVTGGLEPGERVVVDGAGFLSDGARIRMAAASR